MTYDHGPHAGNAGDVWKHLILAETADHLFQDEMWIYVESHVGFPEYRLSRGGERGRGVGRCGYKLESLSTFPYFQKVNFHLGDGLFGAMELAGKRDFALLLIDPPYIDENDANAAEDLLNAAVKAGWVALCWYMTDLNEPPQPSIPFETFNLRFKDAGLEGGRWDGAAVIVAGGDGALIGWLERRTREFLEVLTGATSQSF